MVSACETLAPARVVAPLSNADCSKRSVDLTVVVAGIVSTTPTLFLLWMSAEVPEEAESAGPELEFDLCRRSMKAAEVFESPTAAGSKNARARVRTEPRFELKIMLSGIRISF